MRAGLITWIASSTNTFMRPARKTGSEPIMIAWKTIAGDDGGDDGAPAQPVAGEGDVEGPQRQRHEEYERRQQAGIVGALRYDRDEVDEGVDEGDGEEGQREPRPAPAEQRRHGSEHPYAGYVDGVYEGEGDRAGLGVGLAHVPAHLAAEGIGRALQVDAVLLELVDQVGQYAQPGEPDEVSPARHGEVAAQGVSAEQQSQEKRRAEAHIGPDKRELEHEAPH